MIKRIIIITIITIFNITLIVQYSCFKKFYFSNEWLFSICHLHHRVSPQWPRFLGSLDISPSFPVHPHSLDDWGTSVLICFKIAVFWIWHFIIWQADSSEMVLLMCWTTQHKMVVLMCWTTQHKIPEDWLSDSPMWEPKISFIYGLFNEYQ